MTPELSPEQREQIHEEEKAREQAALRGAYRERVWNVAMLLSATLVLLGGIGWFAVHQSHSTERQKLGEALGHDRRVTEMILKMESSNMTYAELFQTSQASIEARTKLIVDLRGGLYPGIEYDFKQTLLGFLNAENEFVRVKSGLYQNVMEMSAAYKTANDAIASDSWRYKFYTRDRLIETAQATQESAHNLLTAYEGLAKAESRVALGAVRTHVSFLPLFFKYRKDIQQGSYDMDAFAASTLSEWNKIYFY